MPRGTKGTRDLDYSSWGHPGALGTPDLNPFFQTSIVSVEVHRTLEGPRTIMADLVIQDYGRIGGDWGKMSSFSPQSSPILPWSLVPIL